MTRSPQHHPHPASAPAGASVPASLPARRPFAALLLAAPFAFAGTAQAATITVGTQCSLPNAVASAEANADTGGCTGTGQYGDDTIIIPPNQPQVLTEPVNNGGTIGFLALPVITSRITIEGHGNPIRIQRPEDILGYAFARIESGSLTINDATLRGGRSSTNSGSIIASGGTTVLNRVTLTDNTTSAIAGAILVGLGASVTLNNSTVVNNGSFTESQSTTGAIQCSGTLTLNNSTVTGNFAPDSSTSTAGISLTGCALTVNNSIVAGNYFGSPGSPPTYNKPGVEVFNAARRPVNITARHSLFGHAGIQGTASAFKDVTFTASSTGNLVLDGASTSPTALRDILDVDASNLPVLKDNGGPTPTVALVTGSPAINAADPLFTDSTPTAGTALRRDQRRYLLADGDTRRDIGAFEFPGLPPVAPAAPTDLRVKVTSEGLSIGFMPGEPGTSPITNYAYALGDSNNFIPLDPADNEPPVTIPAPTNDAPVSVRLKAISNDGESPASSRVSTGPAAINGVCSEASGTPTASAPADLLCSSGTASAVGGSNGAWRWLCIGTGGGSIASCAAPYAKPTITLTADPTTITVGDDGSTVFASSTSGAKPVLTSTTPSVCALGPFAGSPTGTTMTATGITAGTCTVKATLAGTGDVGEFRYVAADDQTVDITVAKGAQTITGFAADPSALKVGGMATLSATGGASGNAVTFSSLSSDICFVSGAMVTALSAGTCTVAADQAGNDGYAAAAQKTLAITVNKAAQLISGFSANPAALKVGGMAALSASGGASGNPVTFRTTTTEVCSVSGAMVTALSAGTCALVASQAGTADFDAAADVTLNLPVNKAAQLISGFTANPTTIKVGETSQLSAFGGASGKPIVFASTTTDVCSVSGSTVTGLTAGHCALTANQAGTADFDAAETALLAITIEAADVATGPALHLDMNDLDFGTGYLLRFRDVGVQTTSEPEIVTVSNPGTAPLAISSIVTTGDFRHATTCGSTVAPGTTCTIAIRFSPTAVGTRTGETRIVSNAVTSPDRISLSGTGKGLKPAIKTNVSRFDFGRVKVGSVSRDQTLVITSTGTGPLEIRNIAVTGDYVGSHNCPRWLDAGKSCQVTGRFRPRATGVRSGTVSILSSVSNTPTQVSLSGTGF